MESFDEAVTVAVPVTRACEGWTGFKYFPDFMSVPGPSLPDVGQRSSLDEMWPEFDAGIGEEVPHGIAWLCLDGPSRIGRWMQRTPESQYASSSSQKSTHP